MNRPDSLSFDGLIDLYEETRCFDAACFEAALSYIADFYPVRSFPEILEPGIGTGRIALPLAARGYRVTGIDLSRPMLDALRARARKDPKINPLAVFQADVTRLPFPDNRFDLAVATHLFYFIRDWKKAAEEILRVVRKTGSVLLMHTGTGMEIPFLNKRYAELCSGMGYPIHTTGVQSTREVTDYYLSFGCTVDWVRDRWKWTSNIPLKKALEYIRLRAYSFTAFTPEEIHREAVEMLAGEAKATSRGWAATVGVPNQIYLAVVKRICTDTSQE